MKKSFSRKELREPFLRLVGGELSLHSFNYVGSRYKVSKKNLSNGEIVIRVIDLQMERRWENEYRKRLRVEKELEGLRHWSARVVDDKDKLLRTKQAKIILLENQLNDAKNSIDIKDKELRISIGKTILLDRQLNDVIKHADIKCKDLESAYLNREALYVYLDGLDRGLIGFLFGGVIKKIKDILDGDERADKGL
jgi:hypothetical protein